MKFLPIISTTYISYRIRISRPNNPSVATGDATPQFQQVDKPTAKSYTTSAVSSLQTPIKTKSFRTASLTGSLNISSATISSLYLSIRLCCVATRIYCIAGPFNSGGDANFASLPDLSKEAATAKWIVDLADSLGHLHGLRGPTPVPTSQATDVRGDRTFNCEGASKALSKGLISRKPDIILLDRTLRLNVPSTTNLRWPMVQALIEISSASSKGCTDLVRTLMDKASNMFDSQLHRRFVLGIGIYGGKGKIKIPKFIFVLIDRVGAACTAPTYLRGASAITFARIIFAFTYARDEVSRHRHTSYFRSSFWKSVVSTCR